MKELFNRLADDFSDKDYAHSYMEGHAVSRIAAQVYALRRQRGWSQEELSEKSGIAQERISKIESADFNSLTMKTLQKLSKAFDVHLHIAFEAFTTGILDIGNLQTWQLEITSRTDDLESSAVTRDYLFAFGKTSERLPLKMEKGESKQHASSCDRSPRIQQYELKSTASTIGINYG